MHKLYTYKKCGTCQKATKFLKEKKIPFTELPIRETPPSISELETMLSVYDGDLKKLFNTSGQTYRDLDIKTKLPSLTTKEALHLLSENGNLIKRPFLISDPLTTVGFKPDLWEENLK